MYLKNPFLLLNIKSLIRSLDVRLFFIKHVFMCEMTLKRENF